MSWCLDTSRLDPGARAEAAEPWDGGSLGVRGRKPLASVFNQSVFKVFQARLELNTVNVEGQRMVVVLGTELQQGKRFLGVPCGCDGSLIFIF